jgi:hypothetical protein
MTHVARGGNYDNAILRARILQVFKQGHCVTALQLTVLVNADCAAKVKSPAVLALLAGLVDAGDVVKDTSSNGPARYTLRNPMPRKVARGEITERIFAYACSARLTIHNPLTGEEVESQLSTEQAQYYFEKDTSLLMFELDACKFTFLRWENSPMQYERITILTSAMCG